MDVADSDNHLIAATRLIDQYRPFIDHHSGREQQQVSSGKDSGLSVRDPIAGRDEHHTGHLYQQNGTQVRLQGGFRSELKLTGRSNHCG